MITEFLAVAAVFIGGCATMRNLGLIGWGLAPLGFLAGICLQLGIGLLQVAMALPTSPVITLTLTVGLPVAWWIARWRRGHQAAVSAPLAVASLAGLAVAVVALRTENLAKWHNDSLAYLMAGRLIAEGEYRSTASTLLVTTRALGVPLLHAPANLDNGLYLRSVTPLLTAATLASVIWFLMRGARRGIGNARLATFAALAVLLLLTNNRFIFSFFYLNGHLLFAAMVLLIVASGWLLVVGDRAPNRALMVLQIMAIPALVITRPEGSIMGLLVLLPTWLSERIPRRHRSITMAVLGGTTVLYSGFQGWVFLDRDTELPPSVSGLFLLGIVVLLSIPVLWWTFVPRHAKQVLWLTEAGLWLALLALALRSPATLGSSVYATYVNVFRGAGGWGLSIVALAAALLVVCALRSFRVPYQAALRFPLTTFVPLVFLLAYLRGGAYRPGDSDSLNRMVMHVVPLAVLLLFLLLTNGDLPSPTPVDDVRGQARLREATSPAESLDEDVKPTPSLTGPSSGPG